MIRKNPRGERLGDRYFLLMLFFFVLTKLVEDLRRKKTRTCCRPISCLLNCPVLYGGAIIKQIKFDAVYGTSLLPLSYYFLRLLCILLLGNPSSWYSRKHCAFLFSSEHTRTYFSPGSKELCRMMDLCSIWYNMWQNILLRTNLCIRLHKYALHAGVMMLHVVARPMS